MSVYTFSSNLCVFLDSTFKWYLYFSDSYFLHFFNYPLVLPVFLKITIIHSFSWLHHIVLCTCVTSLSIPLLINILFASICWMWKILVQCILGCMRLFKIWFSPQIPFGVVLHEFCLNSFFQTYIQ